MYIHAETDKLRRLISQLPQKLAVSAIEVLCSCKKVPTLCT